MLVSAKQARPDATNHGAFLARVHLTLGMKPIVEPEHLNIPTTSVVEPNRVEFQEALYSQCDQAREG